MLIISRVGRVIVACLMCLSFHLSAEIRLGTALMPPYQETGIDGLQGTTIDTILCVLAKVPEDAKFVLLPRSRLIHSLNRLDTDAIFSLGERKPIIGVISNPIVLEKWYWFYNNELVIDSKNKELQLAVVRGSEAEYWLSQQGYSNIVKVSIIEQALKMLSAGRIDAVLADNLRAQEAARAIDLVKPSEFSTFQKYTSLGVHFSDSFINKNPSVLVSFNRSIQHCNPAGVTLTKADKAGLIKIAATISSWVEADNIMRLLAEAIVVSKNLQTATIPQLDYQWRQQREKRVNDPNSLISKIFNSKLSKELRALKLKSGNLFSELIITNAQGVNIAISDIPSDYWQGDEQKFLKTVGANTLEPFIDRIKYDSSTSTFQSQISMSIKSKTGKIIGMLTAGVNVETALKQKPVK